MSTSQHQDTADILKSIPLLGGLSRRDRSALADSSRLRRLEAYTKLVKQGDPGQSCFVLVEGTAEVLRNAKRVAELSPGEVFGELSLIDGGERTADVTMLTRGEVLELQRAGFVKLLESSPAANMSVLEQLSSRVRELDRTVFWVSLPVGATVPERARVVIIGGGVIGASVAYHLTKLGWNDVVILGA